MELTAKNSKAVFRKLANQLGIEKEDTVETLFDMVRLAYDCGYNDGYNDAAETVETKGYETGYDDGYLDALDDYGISEDEDFCDGTCGDCPYFCERQMICTKNKEENDNE